VLATGAQWRRDGQGRSNRTPLDWPTGVTIKSADDVMAGDPISGEVLVYDDDWFYMGPQVAHRLALSGCRVTLATSSASIADWMRESNLLDQVHLVHDLRAAGVQLRVNQHLVTTPDGVSLHDAVSDQTMPVATPTIVLVTERAPVDDLYATLLADGRLAVDRLSRIGDCLRPSIIADAVYSGHLFARAFDSDLPPAKRDRVVIDEMSTL
jgi:dimethylamine/trimethylamine dehydrogenase